MEKFMRVDIQEYVKKGLESGVLVPVQAKKTAMIHAVPGKLDERVISWVQNADGTERVERDETVKVDEVTGKPGWVVTKVDNNGEPVIDQNGHKNQWIIRDSVFMSTYEAVPSRDNLYSKKDVQLVVQIPDSIVFVNKYGEEMSVEAGGYINITNIEKMYGISERDFNDTHILINENAKKR